MGDLSEIKKEELNDHIQFEGLSEKEVKQLHEIMKRFMQAYHKKAPECSDREWLIECYHAELPSWEADKVEKLADDTLKSIQEYNKNLESVTKAAKQGISSEKWFADEVAKASTGVAINDYGNRLMEIDAAITNGNAQMMRTVSTQAGEISQCYNLDGYIAEQHHVNTFNANASLRNSNYVARVQVPGPGETYGKNSFDCVVLDKSSGKIVQQYQVKYGADAKATIELLRSGNYNNQRFLVPTEQVAEVQAAFPGKTVTDTIRVGDQTSSLPLTKAKAKELQLNTQKNGSFELVDYNTFQTKDLALHIGKNAAMVGLQSAALTTGITLAAKALSGEYIDSDTVIETALTTGADASVKAAAVGALKVGAEKGILSIIPPGTPVHIISSIACMGIENAKILSKVATGELTMSEALDQIGQVSTAMVYGLGWSAMGTLAGAAALSWIPIVGPIAGGLVGGLVGYMAGSKFGETIYKGAKKICTTAKTVASRAWEGVKSVGRAVGGAIKGAVGAVASFFR
jgi:hypothetical protein